MKIRDFILSLVSWFILLVTVSCSDELGGERTPISSESNLHVLVPTVLSSRGTNPDDASGLPTYNATVDECQINDLTLYAFPTGNEGKLLKKTLPAPLASMMLEQHVANYQLNIEPGTYHIYVVANMNKVLSGQTIQTEKDLKKIVLNYYVAGTEPGMPVSTNIPMIYEPKDVNGNIIDTKIEKSGDKYTEVVANLKFTCVKVKLNLLFDPTAEGSAFKGKSYRIKDILAQKLSPSTTLSWNGAFSNSNVSYDYAKGFENEVYATSSEASNKGGYYKAGDWTEKADNANVNNKNIITLVQGATPTAAPQNAADKWLFQGTYYLPERYIANASQQSTLKVNGFVNDSFENNYTIKLGHRPTSTEVPTFPRGTYYEIIGNIKSLGNMTLDCNVSVKDWTPVTIDADFNHTTLWVSKTKASVTSTTTDSIDYESNVMLTEADFGCDEKVTTSSGEKEIVLTKLDAVKHRITFKINEDIKFSDYNGKHTGMAKVWIKAGNIKKYLDVTYDASPYFEVNPQEVTIYWGSDNTTKVVQFKTNLGGLAFTGNTSSTVGKSTILASCDKPDTSEGTFKIKATSNPVTTTVHYLTVQPKESAESFNFVKKIKVTVKPAMGNYRINFRAINDRIPYAGTSDPNKSNVTGNFLGVLTEGGNNNWNDGWFEERWTGDKNQPQTKNHCIYVYTQIGETENAITGKGWIYTEKWGGKDDSGWPGDYMEYDQTNTGWYYKDFSVNAVQKHTQHGATGDRKIKPGETLIMFSNNYNNSVGYSVHRCPQHLEPGIPLFDYEDCEGWIVYDPTSDPTWNIYDAMPTIENIKFTIYTKFQTYGWFKVYGVAHENNGKREQFTIFDKDRKSWSCTNAGNGWYETVITLKTVKGDHEKDIRIMKDNQISDDKSILLFNGNSYEKHDDTGWYDGSSWHAGKPSDVSK